MSQAVDVPAGSPRSVVTRRIREAGISADPFADIDGPVKTCYDHDTRYATPPAGKYAVFPVGRLVFVDVDDYRDGATLDTDLPPTFTTGSPHGGEHLWYLTDVDLPDKDADWGEIRVDSRYVLGPGSVLEDCDKDSHDCSQAGEGHYRIKRNLPITHLDAEAADALLAAAGCSEGSDQRRDSVAGVSEPGVTDDAGNSNGRQGVSIGPDNEGAQTATTEPSDPRTTLDVENDVGLSLREIKRFSRKLNDCLMGLKRTDDPSPSETDFATVDLLHMYRFDRPAIERVLLSWRRVQDRHVVDDYIPRTLANADPLPPVPGPLLRTLVDQSDWTTDPDAGRDTIVDVTLAVERLAEPFTTTQVVDTGLLDHSDATRASVRRRVLRTLKLLDPEYVRLGKSGGQYQCIRTDAFTELTEYARQVYNRTKPPDVISVRPSPAEDSKTAARRSDTASGR